MLNNKQSIPYITAFVLVSCVCGLVYVAVQQGLRQSANDPQIQLAENSAKQLESIDNVNVGTDKVDLASALDPFIIVAKKDGSIIASSAILDGQQPKPPAGIYDTASKKGEYHVTWQPKTGVREALVVVPVKNKDEYVVVGRSLREVEKRENQIFQISALAWLVMLIVSFGGILAYNWKPKEKVAEEQKTDEPIDASPV